MQPYPELFSTPSLIFFDSLRIVAGLACLVMVVTAPYAIYRDGMNWHQKLRFIGAAGLAVALIASYISTLGTNPQVPWRSLVAAVSVIMTSIGYVAYVRQRQSEQPMEPPTRNVDRMENVNAAFIIADENGRIITASGMTNQVIGWNSTALIGRPLATLVPPRYIDSHFAGMDRMAQTGEARISGVEQSMSVMTRDRVERPIRLFVLPLPQIEPADSHRYLGIMMRPPE